MIRIFLLSCAFFFILGVTLSFAADHLDVRRMATYSLVVELLPAVLFVLLIVIVLGVLLFRRRRHEQRT